MKNGKPESLAEALLLIEKMKGQLSEKNEKIEKQKLEIQEQQNKIREKQVEIERLNELLAHKRYREFAAKSEKTRKINAGKPFDGYERTATCGWFSAASTRFAPTISDGLEAEGTCFHSLKILKAA